jgi:hypothetical protein
MAGNKWGAKIEKNHYPENFIKQLCDNSLRKMTFKPAKGAYLTAAKPYVVTFSSLKHGAKPGQDLSHCHWRWSRNGSIMVGEW